MINPLRRFGSRSVAPSTTPVGTVIMYAGPIEDKASPPGPERVRLQRHGWLVCDGSQLPVQTSGGQQSVYWPLFQVIGTSYGGDGKPYFQLPDYRGCFLRARDFDNGTQPFKPRDPDWQQRGPVGSVQDTVVQTHGHNYFHLDPTGKPTYITGEGASALGVITSCATDYGAPEAWVGKTFTETRPINMSINMLIKFTPLVGVPEDALAHQLGIPATPWSLLGLTSSPDPPPRRRR